MPRRRVCRPCVSNWVSIGVSKLYWGLGRWWEGPGVVLFVDGAYDGLSGRMGGFPEFLGFRSAVATRLRSQGQQLVELQSLAWGCLWLLGWDLLQSLW